MMSRNIDCGRINCMSCPSNCEIKPNASLRVSFCHDYCFCTWPGSGDYFSLGVMEGILKQTYNNLYLGCIFVDFSISYLRHFMEKRWIDYLTETKLKIVIVCDKYLRPLANYWFKHDKAIFLVIYPNDKVAISRDKLSKRAIYQRDAFFKGEALSTLEFDVLRALIAGENCEQLADSLSVNIRRIYSAKRRAEKKMGADINTLFRYSHAI